MRKGKKPISILLREKGIKQADIARELGVSQAAVSLVINGISKSKKISAYIDQLLSARSKAA